MIEDLIEVILGVVLCYELLGLIVNHIYGLLLVA